MENSGENGLNELTAQMGQLSLGPQDEFRVQTRRQALRCVQTQVAILQKVTPVQKTENKVDITHGKPGETVDENGSVAVASPKPERRSTRTRKRKLHFDELFDSNINNEINSQIDQENLAVVCKENTKPNKLDKPDTQANSVVKSKYENLNKESSLEVEVCKKDERKKVVRFMDDVQIHFVEFDECRINTDWHYNLTAEGLQIAFQWRNELALVELLESEHLNNSKAKEVK